MAGIHFDITGDNSNFLRRLREVENGVKNTSKQIEQSGLGIEGLFNRMTRAAAAFGAGFTAKELISNIAQVRGEFQQLEVAFKTMLGSEDKANALMQQLVKTAATTPFDLQGVANGAKQLLAYGENVENVNDDLIRLGNIAAGLSQPLGDIVYLYGTTMTQGRLYTADLNQFTGRGIPMIRELAKVFGVAEGEVKSLVEAGKVGFPEVQKVIQNLTNEGGMFYNLMQEQSKTITGQISNIEDAVSTMFNEIGKANEGIINEALSGVSYLVENYEKVGKVLVGLVATYGVYKVAVMTVTALQALQASGIAALTIAERAHYGWLVLQTTAQKALNAVMFTNPYVLLATAVVGLGAAMWTFHDSTTESEKALDRFNKKQEEAQKLEQEHKQKIDSLVQSSRDIALSDLQRGQSLAELRKEYPKIFEQYDIESIKLADILKLKQQIAAEDTKRAGEKQEKELSDIEAEIKYYENLLKSLSGQQGIDGYVKKLKELRADRDVLLQEKGKVISEQFISGLNNIDISEFDRYIAELEKRIKGKGENGKIKLRLPIDVKGSLSDEAIYDVKDIQTLIDTAKSKKLSRIDEEKNKTTYQEDLANAKVEWEKAKKGYEALIKDQTATSKQVKEAKDKMEASEKAYKDLGGVTGSELVKQENQSRKEFENQIKQSELQMKNAKALARQLEDIYLDSEQSRIDAMEEGSKKTLDQMELNHEKELLAIDREKEELIQAKINAAKAEFEAEENVKAAKNPNYKKQTFDASGIILSDTENSLFDNKYKSALDRQAKERQAYYNAEKQAMNDYLVAYGTYLEKRNAIIAQSEEKKKGKNEWEQKTIDEETKQSLSDLDIEANKKTSAITKLFGDMRERTVSDMRAIADEAERAFQFLQSGEWDEKKGLEFGISKETFDTLRKSPEELEKIRKGIKEINDEADSSDTAFNKMAIGLKKVFQSGSNTKKLKEGLADIENGLNDVLQVGQFLSNTLSNLGDAFGNDTLNGVAEGINVAMDAASSAMSGAQAGAMFGPWGAAAGAAIGLVSSLGSSLAKLHDAKHEKKIQELQDQIEVLEKNYEKLGDSVEKAYSKDASKLIDQQNTLLEQQKVLIRNQIAEEKDKKKTDWDRIKEWENQIEEIDKLIEDNKEKAVDAIFGEDLKSAIDNFANAYADAWEAGNDRAKSAKDVVRDMMRQMVTESIKAAIQSSKSMEDIRKKLQEFYADNVLSGWEQDYIYNMAEQLQKELDAKFGWADNLMKDESATNQQQATSRGFGTEMTHEDAGELSGRFTALQIAGEEIKNQSIAQTSLLQMIYGLVSGIIIPSPIGQTENDSTFVPSVSSSSDSVLNTPASGGSGNSEAASLLVSLSMTTNSLLGVNQEGFNNMLLQMVRTNDYLEDIYNIQKKMWDSWTKKLDEMTRGINNAFGR